jgi:tripartite-type tricarboxylate transporter receptor subunit TctC
MGLKEPNDPAWYGLVAPAGTPDDVINKLNAAVVKALQDKAFVQRLQAAGAEPSGNTPAQHAAEIKKEFDKMKNLVKVQNIKLEQ